VWRWVLSPKKIRLTCSLRTVIRTLQEGQAGVGSVKGNIEGVNCRFATEGTGMPS
jgi:hypothetical protein